MSKKKQILECFYNGDSIKRLAMAFKIKKLKIEQIIRADRIKG